METCKFLCLHVKILHESTKICMFHVFSPFNAHLYIIMDKARSIVHTSACACDMVRACLVLKYIMSRSYKSWRSCLLTCGVRREGQTETWRNAKGVLIEQPKDTKRCTTS